MVVARRGPRRSRDAFSILELLVVVILMGILIGAAQMNISSSGMRVRQESEANRLLGALRLLRELSRSGGRNADPTAPVGYGMFFWGNPNAGSCFQYSIYAPVNPTVPNIRDNQISPNRILGTPNELFSTSNLSADEMSWMVSQGLGSAISGGFRIYFQTDDMNRPDLIPDAVPSTLVPPGPPNNSGWNGFRVVFWPPGHRAAAFWTPGGAGQEFGVTIPKNPNTAGGVYYNRIYVASAADNPANPGAPKLPFRIHIDPGTGIVRMMSPWERRFDGSW